MTESFSDVARSMQGEWAAAFARSDWAAIAALYAPDVSFYGSTPVLHTDAPGVLSYFEGLPPGFYAARYAVPDILPLGPELFAASGTVVFVIQVDGQETEHPYRMSQVFRRTPDGWRIALHHASPRPG